MTETEFNQWLTQSSQKTVNGQKIILFSQIILSAAMLFFILNVIPIIFFMVVLFLAIGSYKRTADELALLKMSLHSWEENVSEETTPWYYEQTRYSAAISLLKTTISRLVQHNTQFGYRILFYMLLTLISYFLF